jgi:hypothetical protein
MPDDRFPEPEPDDWEPLSLDQFYNLSLNFDDLTPLDLKPYKPVLTPLDVPPYVKPPDHTQPIHGWTPGTGTGPRDQLSKLTVAQQVDLLNKNNIYLSTKQVSPTDKSGCGSLAAYVIGEKLKPAPSSRPWCASPRSRCERRKRGAKRVPPIHTMNLSRNSSDSWSPEPI